MVLLAIVITIIIQITSLFCFLNHWIKILADSYYYCCCCYFCFWNIMIQITLFCVMVVCSNPKRWAPERHTCTQVDVSPMTISELCNADLWCVSLSCPWTRSKSSLSDSLLSQAESSIPSRFHVRNWNVTDSVSVAASNGSDRKLLLELKKVADTSWGSEQVKVTLPWNDRLWDG